MGLAGIHQGIQLWECIAKHIFQHLDRPERQSSADGMKGDEVGSMDENKSTLFQPNPENDIFLLMGDNAGKKIRDMIFRKGRSQII